MLMLSKIVQEFYTTNMWAEVQLLRVNLSKLFNFISSNNKARPAEAALLDN